MEKKKTEVRVENITGYCCTYVPGWVTSSLWKSCPTKSIVYFMEAWPYVKLL